MVGPIIQEDRSEEEGKKSSKPMFCSTQSIRLIQNKKRPTKINNNRCAYKQKVQHQANCVAATTAFATPGWHHQSNASSVPQQSKSLSFSSPSKPSLLLPPTLLISHSFLLLLRYPHQSPPASSTRSYPLSGRLCPQYPSLR